MKGSSALDRLLLAADLSLEQRVRDLRRVEAELSALRAEADALRAMGRGTDNILAMRGDAAHLAATWERQRDRRLAELGLRAAALAVAREQARAEAARASGRVSAIRSLMG